MQDCFIDLPSEDVAKSTGFSIDFGGSLIKILYRPKDQKPDFKEQVRQGYTRLCLKTYTASELDKVLDDIIAGCDVTRRPGQPITCTGVGCHTHERKICDSLGVSTKIETEFDVLVTGLVYLLRHLPGHEILDQYPVQWQDEVLSHMKIYSEFLASSYESGGTKNRSVTNVEKQLLLDEIEQDLACRNRTPKLDRNAPAWVKSPGNGLPVIFANMGSASTVLEINSEEDFRVVDYNPVGGRTLIGMGKALTGAKSFEELAELAQNGISSNVDTVVGDSFGATKSETSTSMYDEGHQISNFVSFSFGKLTLSENIDAFRKEDVARSLVEVFAMNAAHVVCLHAMRLGIPNVLCGGGISHNSIVRKTMLKYAGTIRVLNVKDNPVRIQFLKYGSHLGVIGGFIKDIS